jgi:hypothetical protein
MGVFLRWGVFGILAVAALVYAYNASKRMAAQHQNAAAVSQVPAPAEIDESSETDIAPDVLPRTEIVPPHCEVELFIAQRAMEARRDGEPLDRLLRIQEIAFVNDPRLRKRRELVATRWFEYAGAPPISEALSIGVVSDCRQFSPVP